jgi:hypothetical protein
LKSFYLGFRFMFFGLTNESDIIAHDEIIVLGQIGVGRSLLSGDNIRCLDRQRSDFTVRWHLVGDRRAGDEPDTDFSTPAT